MPHGICPHCLSDCSQRGKCEGITSECKDPGYEWKLVRGNQVLFANDTALVADLEEIFQRLVEEIGRAYERRKLKVNVEKNKVLTSRREGVKRNLEL